MANYEKPKAGCGKAAAKGSNVQVCWHCNPDAAFEADFPQTIKGLVLHWDGGEDLRVSDASPKPKAKKK